jgi:hypothetical protein
VPYAQQVLTALSTPGLTLDDITVTIIQNTTRLRVNVAATGSGGTALITPASLAATLASPAFSASLTSGLTGMGVTVLAIGPPVVRTIVLAGPSPPPPSPPPSPPPPTSPVSLLHQSTNQNEAIEVVSSNLEVADGGTVFGTVLGIMLFLLLLLCLCCAGIVFFYFYLKGKRGGQRVVFNQDGVPNPIFNAPASAPDFDEVEEFDSEPPPPPPPPPKPWKPPPQSPGARAASAAGALVGRRVLISGLQGRAELNGREGDATEFKAANGRYTVTVETIGGQLELLAIKAINLQLAPRDLSIKEPRGDSAAPDDMGAGIGAGSPGSPGSGNRSTRALASLEADFDAAADSSPEQPVVPIAPQRSRVPAARPRQSRLDPRVFGRPPPQNTAEGSRPTSAQPPPFT